ncbi:MAG TPA: hypothetical protein VMT12_15930 [Syntrophales bacterium]|nr:hypothetical protein [Syntrophales bacterium]
MLKANRQKDPENILREEMMKERAEVLGRAGEKLSAAIEKVRIIEQGIEERLKSYRSIVEKSGEVYNDGLVSLRQKTVKEINGEIGRFNHAREYAKLRYYYLIVTREAMGLRRHHWVEESYRIPPRKKYLRDV